MLAENYRIIQQLGAKRPRRFGEIYLAESIHTSQKVILKVVNKLKCDSIAVERLRNESSFSFTSEGLPSTLDFSEDASMAYLVREYFDGETIDNYWNKLRRKEQLPFLILFLKKLDDLLSELNTQKIVHCDIKPGNILVSGSSNEIKISLIDFGLALKTDAPEKRKMLFPLGYAAPELVLNHLEIVDYRTDYYAIGVLVWRLFAGKMPLIHPNPSVFTNLQLTHPLPDHDSIPRKILPLLKKLSFKYSFEIPPNRLSKEEVRKKLIEAIDTRYNDLSHFIADVEKSKIRRFWF